MDVKVRNVAFDNKFGLFKIEDAKKYLTSEEKDQLADIMQTIRMHRILDGKDPDKHYLVINVNEPYAGQVAEIMKQHGHYREELTNEPEKDS